MDDTNATLASAFVSKRYVEVGMENVSSTRKMVKELMTHRRIPDKGWDESTIECFLRDIARMDSNNFVGNTGVGEREGRVVCPIVSRRHYHLAHGIGRSGDIAAEQPKAAGSTILAKLVRFLALDAIRLAGVKRAKSCLVLPIATGMTFALVLSTLRRLRGSRAKFVVWSRCDQKSCFKAILSAGLIPVVVETKIVGDAVTTDMDNLRRALDECGGPENVLCVASTTSCFAPRTADDVEAIAIECKKRNVPHICNNAYGLQSTRCCHLVNEAMRVGRLDAFVQSTDKNFQVPVGGAIVASADASFVEEVGKSYAGRASMSPLLDLLITFLYVGREKMKRMNRERKSLAKIMRKKLSALAAKYGERVLDIPQNTISMAMTLSHLLSSDNTADNGGAETRLGAMLFRKRVSGVRTVARGVQKTIGDYTFDGFGASVKSFPYPYLTAACALGTTENDVDLFLSRLEKALKSIKKQRRQKSRTKDKNDDDTTAVTKNEK